MYALYVSLHTPWHCSWSFVSNGPHCNPPHKDSLLCQHPYYTVLLSSPLILSDFIRLENPFVNSNPPNTIFTIN